MRKWRLLWQVYLPFLVIVVAALVAASTLASQTLKESYLSDTRSDLEVRATLLRHALADRIDVGEARELDALIRDLGRLTATRFTLILADGSVLADSARDPSLMDNHRDRPEVKTALSGGVGSTIRFSATLGRELMYVAVPVGAASGRITGAVRAAVALTAIDSALLRIYSRIAGGGVLIAALAAIVSLVVSQRVTRPVGELRRGIERFARGELSVRLPETGAAEIAALSRATNKMASELEARILELVDQTSEQDGVLSSMVEGVLAVSRDLTVLTLNRSAATLLHVDDRDHAAGRTLRDVVANPEIVRFVLAVLDSDEPVERELILHGQGMHYIQAHGAPIRTAQRGRSGAVVVLNDVTRLRRLETVRKDFVANVSHELKTPITSIRASVETLIDGASEDPQAGQRFLKIILRQADRLSAIIEDLLSLSRIEQEADQGGISTRREPLRGVLDSATDACRSAADAAGVELRVTSSGEAYARINAALLEQALVNLIDNAVKYSEEGSSVEVSLAGQGSRVCIAVRDHGIGIEGSDIERLFERFYRVDKARSRKLGGTGLGLAIVKHIVQAHAGTVSVESVPGQGSTFVIDLPAA